MICLFNDLFESVNIHSSTSKPGDETVAKQDKWFPIIGIFYIRACYFVYTLLCYPEIQNILTDAFAAFLFLMN